MIAKSPKIHHVCFVDKHKAFYTVCVGNFLTAIQSLYNEVKCTVRVNNDLTPWFNVEAGVKQGCILSPILFSVYINDLADRINSLNCGVPFDDFCLSLLL